jgi:hypothetical protein
MKYAGRVVRGVPFFFERLPVTGRIALPALQLLERENVMLRLALAECENGGADSQESEPMLDINSFVHEICGIKEAEKENGI